MFHSEFFPTNEETLDLMQLDAEGKIILDPSAGSGSILDYALRYGAKRTLAIEITNELRSIVKEKHELIGKDFFDTKEEDIAHVNAIYMNPPFSNADKHILHAWKIAPEGCEIVSICNFETINNTYSGNRRQLECVIRDYGYSQGLGNTFIDAERTTSVEIGLIKLFKPITSSSFNFDNYFLDEEEVQEEGEGIQQYNEVKALVNRYVGCMRQFDNLLQSVESINYQLKAIGSSGIEMTLSRNENIMNKQSFSKEIQKRSWKYIFDKMNMEKYVT
jgi:predicted rRNA methylase YqxC with S4 and FtsJ domains